MFQLQYLERKCIFMKRLCFVFLSVLIAISLMGCANSKATNKGVAVKDTKPAVVNQDSILYVNNQYGFSFKLPSSWKGYSIVTGKWEGVAIGGKNDGKIVETGPILSIRHPLWTSQEPRQDIPIMIFTLEQWKSLQQGEFHIGAAPINPSELGRNSTYVFALPARYNYAFPKGYEEVEDILKGNPLSTEPQIIK